MSLCNLTSNSLGPCPKLMKWAYEGIVKPMFTYAALVWAHEINTDVLRDKLRKLNRLAMNTFCLTPKSVSTRLLEVITDTMPLNLFCQLVGIKTYYRQLQVLRLGWEGTYKNKTYSISHMKHWANIQEKIGISIGELDTCLETCLLYTSDAADE